MGWTTPSTVAAGDAILASLWNQQVRDNMSSLVEAGTTLPASPVDGQSYYYIADATNGVVWHMRYRAANTDWEFVGGPPLVASDFAARSRATVAHATWTYIDNTNDPRVTIPVTGDYVIQLSSTLGTLNTGTVAMGVDNDGTTPIYQGATGTSTMSYVVGGQVVYVGFARLFTGLVATKVVKHSYYHTTGGGTTTLSRYGAAMTVTPVRFT